MPESWMSAGIRSTPSGWCRIPSPGRSGSSIRIRPIASDRVKGSLSGWGVAQADGQAALRVPRRSAALSFRACASPIPRFAQVVVLPTPPFWLAMAMICVFNDFTSFLNCSMASGNRKKPPLQKLKVTAFSYPGMKFPRKRKKRPVENTERLAIRFILFCSKLGQIQTNRFHEKGLLEMYK